LSKEPADLRRSLQDRIIHKAGIVKNDENNFYLAARPDE
jgi:hypothetical protein